MSAWLSQRRISDAALKTPTRMSGSAGARDSRGQPIPFQPDPLRVRSMNWLPEGYMSSGYDTGRVW